MIRLLLVLLLASTLAPTRVWAVDKTSPQTMTLPTGPLAFTASVETIRLSMPDGAPAADIVTTAFMADGSHRPVTFAFNGGPGAASAWLNLGAIGPWRVPITLPIRPSQDPALVDNTETWLPFTDLVFIDPVGTGYSRALGPGDAQRPFLAVDADIRTLATTIHRWLAAHGRLTSPVFIVGESYGGFRAPLLARALLEQQGIGVAGLVIVSPVFDFNGRDSPYDPLRWAARLPVLAAAARGATTREAVADAEAYAATDFITDLLRGPNDPAALDRLTTRVAALTGLDPALVRRRQGRIDLDSALRTAGRVASSYDATITTPDPFPAAAQDNSPDPVLDGLRAPVTAAALTEYARLGWQPDGEPRVYQLLNGALAREWDYGRSNTRPEAMTALRQYLALDPAARVVVVHGITDLVTPYFATALLLQQVTATPRLSLVVLPGGHMSYLRDDSRAALATQARAVIER